MSPPSQAQHTNGKAPGRKWGPRPKKSLSGRVVEGEPQQHLHQSDRLFPNRHPSHEFNTPSLVPAQPVQTINPKALLRYPGGPPGQQQQQPSNVPSSVPLQQQASSSTSLPDPAAAHHQLQQPATYVRRHRAIACAPKPPEFRLPQIRSPAEIKREARASHACNRCRKLKSKCDEKRPCQKCRDTEVECVYQSPLLQEATRLQMWIVDEFNSIRTELRTLRKQVEQLSHDVARRNGGHDIPRSTDERTTPTSPRPFPETMRFSPSNSYDTDDMLFQMIGTPTQEEGQAEPGSTQRPREPAIPANHTTSASVLLKWSSIFDLVQDTLKSLGVEGTEKYPLEMELPQRYSNVHNSMDDLQSDSVPNISRDLSEISLGSSALGPELTSDQDPLDQTYSSLLAPDDDDTPDYTKGNVSFVTEEVWSYVGAFKANILNMHPIVEPQTVDQWVQQFLDVIPLISPISLPMASFQATPIIEDVNTLAEVVGTKRKRPSGLDDDVEPADAASVETEMPGRSMSDALVLMVLALGKISLHRGKIPDLAPAQKESRQVRNDAQPDHQPMGNREIVPGFDYFSHARDILEKNSGKSHSMKRVQANIFAALYYGQLAAPVKSFEFATAASRELQLIMAPNMVKMDKVIESGNLISTPEENEMVLAFWTCLQLERWDLQQWFLSVTNMDSDIIAELPLLQSGLLQYESLMPYPNMTIVRGFEQRVLDSYLGQIYLRNHLNRIHRKFYSPGTTSSSAEAMAKDVGLISEAVCDMQWVPPSFVFHEEDAPATDILDARLRAKYWGAQVITYRPFIKQVLESSQTMRGISGTNAVPMDAENMGCLGSPVSDHVRKGIKALIESTRAFHGLGDQRPIISNVFGTAHAQWGNLLVLSAAFRHPTLRPLIDAELLCALFQRTILFLGQSATATNGLQKDLQILEEVEQVLFEDPWVKMSPTL